MSFVLVLFGAGLWGEETPLVSLQGLLCFWDETRWVRTPSSWSPCMDNYREKQASGGTIYQSVTSTEAGSLFENGLVVHCIGGSRFRAGRMAGFLKEEEVGENRSLVFTEASFRTAPSLIFSPHGDQCVVARYLRLQDGWMKPWSLS